MDLKLTGKIALVTGSTAGIGFAIAKSLASEGAHIYVNGARSSASMQRWRQSDRMLRVHPSATVSSARGS